MKFIQYVVGLLFFFACMAGGQNLLRGQCLPFPPICNANPCNIPNVDLTITVLGNNVVCDGAAAAIAVDPETSLNFDYLYIYWCDYVVDTINFAEQPAVHVYNVPDSLLCESAQNSYFVHVIGVKYCNDSTFTCRTGATSLTVNNRPLADFSVIGGCLYSPMQLINESCNGEEYLWVFGDGTFSTEPNPQHQYDAAGNYSVSLIVSNSCGVDTQTYNLLVVEDPVADFIADPAFSCTPDTVSFTNLSNQWSFTFWEIENDTASWSFADSLMSLNSYDLELSLNQYEDYIITLFAVNACGRDSLIDTIHIFPYPSVSIMGPPVFCDSSVVTAASLGFVHSGEITGFEWEFENGEPASASGEDFGTVVFYQSGAVRLYAFSPCDTLVRVVNVPVAGSDQVLFGNNPATLCQSDPPTTLSAQPTGGAWAGQGPAAGSITPEGVLDPSSLPPSTYTFVFTIPGTEDCPSVSDSIPIQIIAAISAQISPVDTACESLVYTPQVAYGGDIDTYTWTFPGGTPAASSLPNPSNIDYGEPGDFQAFLTVEGFCGTVMDTVDIVVQENLQVEIIPPQSLICSSSQPFELQADHPGGVWSGAGITDPDLGTFDPAEAGSGLAVVQYSLGNGACLATDTEEIPVTLAESVVFPADTFCIDSEPRELIVSPTGGSFSGQGTDPETGLFDPASAGTGITDVGYVYTDASGCVITSTVPVLVDSLPLLSLANTALLCLSDFTTNLPEFANFDAQPTGGIATWIGPGVLNAQGDFNPADAGLSQGVYTIYVDYERNDCRVRDSLMIELIEAQPLSLSPDTTVCISDGTLQLTANLPGGDWSGPGIDDEGLIDLSLAGGNQTHSYFYDFLPGTSCAQAGSVQVEIIDLSGLVDAGPDIAVCHGLSTYTLGGATPAGQGYWVGPGLMDPSSGQLDLGLLETDVVYVFQYCLESQAVAGCSACDSRTFIIHSNPVAAFGLDGTTCEGETFNIENNSSGATQYFWNFGDNTTSTLHSPSHQYDLQGNYTIQLIAAAATGCRDTAAFEVFVTTPPMPAFTLTGDEGCAPFPLAINDNSSGFDISLTWHIDGEIYSGSPPTGIVLDSITQDSVFIIRLVASNLCGDRFVEDSVLVRPYPIVRFGIFPDEGCSPLTVDLANTSAGNPQTFLWDFGNGDTSTDFLPPFPVYTTSGDMVSTYTITLTATNDCGADTLSKQIVVYPPDVEAFIEADTLSGCQPLTVNLQSYSTPGSVITWVIIDENGNQQQGGNQETLEAIINTPGLHQVILYAGRCGTDADTAYIEVLPAPTAGFTHRPTVCADRPIDFLNTSSPNISASEWDFGDGNFSSAHSPTYTYDISGFYTVTLTVYSQVNNCPDTFSSVVEVTGNPVAAFTPSATNGCSPLTISFEDNSSGAVYYHWDFGDEDAGSIEAEPTHTFEQSGNYTVTLTVFGADSCFSATSIANIFVFPDPVANFDLNDQIYCLGHSNLHPVNLSEDAAAYEWRWQNEIFSTAQPVITPEEAGEFPLQLIVWNTFQCSDTFVRQVEILPSPIAGFTPSQTAGCMPLPVQFSNTSVSSENYTWNFGDGNGSAAMSPGHLFGQAGQFTVTLIAETTNGCPADTVQQFIQVWPKPVAAFAYDKPDTCGTPITVLFSNLSEGASQNDWQFGDGGASSLTHPSYVFQTPGVFEVELIVANTHLCRDTTAQLIDIFGRPAASFITLPQEGCEDLTVVFLNQSAQAFSYQWLIEPFTQPIEEHSPTLLFTEPGVYDATLIAVYNSRCRDTLFLPDHIRVYESPEASFSYSTGLQENILGEVEFFNTSQKSDRYFWDLGDGTITTEENPYHEYSINRDVEVLLIAYNDNGGAYTCVDTIRLPVEPEWITTFFAPNALSPEYGEEEIRVFRPTGTGLAEYQITVYSPWGGQVWFSTALEEGRPAESWNGAKHNKGPILPQGAYSWRADVVFVNGERRVYTGSVNLLR